MNKILLTGASLGLLSVLMAAYVDHSLSITLGTKSLQSVLVAVKYHQLYAIIISFIGLLIPLQANPKIKLWLMITGYTFIVGILLFSFSIYFTDLTGILNILPLVPVGGVLLMIGWVCLLRTALLK